MEALTAGRRRLPGPLRHGQGPRRAIEIRGISSCSRRRAARSGSYQEAGEVD
jgi:hypothetical protein